MKTFPFGLILMGHISVFLVNDPKSMTFFYNFRIFRISCDICCTNHSVEHFQLFAVKIDVFWNFFRIHTREESRNIVLRGKEKIVPICKIYWERSMKFAPDFFFYYCSTKHTLIYLGKIFLNERGDTLTIISYRRVPSTHALSML